MCAKLRPIVSASPAAVELACKLRVEGQANLSRVVLDRVIHGARESSKSCEVDHRNPLYNCVFCQMDLACTWTSVDDKSCIEDCKSERYKAQREKFGSWSRQQVLVLASEPDEDYRPQFAL